jgi:hypothetical protein
VLIRNILKTGKMTNPIKTVEELEIMKAFLTDMSKNVNIPIHVQLEAGRFAFDLVKVIRMEKCSHLQTKTKTQYMHNDDYEFIYCCDCGKCLDVKRID